MIMEKEIIKWEDFNKIDLRVGTIVNIEIFEKAVKPAFKIWVDFGYFGIKKTSAQIRKNYSKDDLIGQQIIDLNLINEKENNLSQDFKRWIGSTEIEPITFSLLSILRPSLFFGSIRRTASSRISDGRRSRRFSAVSTFNPV